MKVKSSSIKTGLLASFLALMAMPLAAATLSFNFNLSATGNPSVKSINVATLEITDILGGGGVQMTLKPNWGLENWTQNGYVNSLQIVMPNLPSLNYGNTLPSSVSDLTLDNKNIDSGYSSAAKSLVVNFKNANKDRFKSGTVDWKILGDLSTNSFMNLIASANNKPSDIFGVISLSGFSGDTSNWVAGSPSAVPIPAAAYLFGSALLGMAGIGYRRNKKQA